MGIGGIVSGAADAARKAAEAAKRAAEAAARAAAKRAAEAAKKAAEAAKKAAAEKAQKVSSAAADRARDVFEGAKSAVSGAASKAKDVAGSAVNKAQKVAGGAVDKAQEVAGGAVDKAQKVAGGAVDKAQKVAGGAVDKAQEVAGGAVERAQEAAGAAVNKVRGAADRAADVFEDARDVAGAVGRAASHAVRHPGQVLDKATDVAAAGLDKAGEAIQNAPTTDPVSRLKNQVVGGLLQTGADVVRDPVETARAVKDAASINKQVDDLGRGEQVKVELNAEGDVSGVGLKGKGELAVSRNAEGQEDGYTVSVNGELGVGVVGKLGGTGAAKVGGSAFLNGGAKVEFQFDTAEEARRAADIIARSAAVGAAGAATPALAPVTGAAANRVLGDPLSELAGLSKNLSAVELKLSGEAEGGVSLGVDGLEGAATAGANAGINGELGQTARIEFENGRASKLSVKQTWQVGAGAGIEAGLGLPEGAQGGSLELPTNASAGASRSFSAEFEQSFELPQDFQVSSLLRDPVGATRELTQTARATHEGKLTLTDSSQAHAQGLGRGGNMGSEVQVELSGNVQELANSGALGSAIRGDFGQALRQTEGKLDAQASIQEKTTSTRGASIGYHAGAAGGEVGIQSERTHLGEERELTASELAELYLQQRYATPLMG
jgi:hypothetical protein